MMLAHVPFAPPFFTCEHAWQRPPHALLQQKPSTQKPLEHSAFDVHAALFASFVQAPAPLQLVTPAHSASGSVAFVTFAHVPFAAPVFAFVQA